MEWKEKLLRCFRLKYLLPVSFGAVIAAVLLRVFQLNTAIDFTTGFFSKRTVLVPLLTFLLIAFFGYIIVQLVYNRPGIANPYGESRQKPTAVMTAAAGLVLIVEGVSGLLAEENAAADFRTLLILSLLLEAATGVVLLYHAYLIFHNRQEQLCNHPWFLIAAVWSLLLVIRIFVQHTTIASISEYTFEILFAASLVLFLLYYGRFTAGILRQRQLGMFWFSGFASVMLGAVAAVPPFFCKALASDGAGKYIAAPSFSFLAFLVFIGWTLYLMMTAYLKNGTQQLGAKKQSDLLQCEYQYESVKVDRLF